MAKPKCPFRKHQLPKQKVDPYTPPKDKAEGTDVRERGYWPGSGYTMAELEFIKAVDDFRKKSGRKFLSAVDFLRLAVRLGYSQSPQRPKKDRRMNTHQIITGLLTAGFQFSLATDGSATFHRPDTDSPEVVALLGLVAWCWGDLEPAIRAHLTAPTATSILGPPSRAGPTSAG